MIRIVLTDDENIYLQEAKKIIDDFFRINNSQYKITIYNKSQNLIYDISEQIQYDIFILDIEMPDKTGIDLTRIIRKTYENAIIIFLTSHYQYAIDSFELSIFRYIPKKIIKHKLPNALRDAVNLINTQIDKYYLISTATKFEKILYKDILYFYKDRKYTKVVTTKNGESKVRKSLLDVSYELNAEEFAFIDRSYIVNICSINKIQNNTIVLINGENLYISRPKLNLIKEKLNNYWRGKL